jgi:hypothetical protein
MKKIIEVGMVAALLLGSTLIGSAAQAQSFYFNPGYGRIHGGFRSGFHNDFRARQLTQEILSLRADINARLASGRIPPQRASMLLSRLDNLSAQQQMMLSDGRLNMEEVTRLRARLDNIRVAARFGGGFRYY